MSLDRLTEKNLSMPICAIKADRPCRVGIGTCLQVVGLKRVGPLGDENRAEVPPDEFACCDVNPLRRDSRCLVQSTLCRANVAT